VSSLDQARALFESALAAQQRGELRSAARLYRDALSLAPDRPSVLNNLAGVCLDLDLYADATACLERLAELEPGDAAAHLRLANCRMEIGSFAAALASCDRALAIKPDLAEALLCRGSALLELGRPQEALASFRSALDIGLPSAPGWARKPIQVWRISNSPAECFDWVSPATEGDSALALEPVTLRTERPAAGTAIARIPARVAKLVRGAVLGLSFVPATEDGRTCLDWFVFNPRKPDKVRGFEDARTMPVTGPRALVTGFDGVDEHAEGVLIGNHSNFGHWMLNHLARLALVESTPALEAVPLVVGENISASQLECLQLMGIDDSRMLRLRRGRLARFETLWAPMMPFCGVGPVAYWVPEIIDFLRQRLGVPLHPAVGRDRRRLYLTRRAARWRRVLNESELASLLARHGFEIVDPGMLTVRQQLALAADAEVIAGPFGAGMNLLLFAPADAHVIELKPLAGIPMDINPALARRIGQSYREVIGAPSIADSVSPLDYDFTVSPGSLEEAMRAAGIGG
jgi:hypothetical protein